MVVGRDLCMVTWASHVDQTPIERENILTCMLCFVLTHIIPVRENGTYYWLHCRKGKDDIEVNADIIQMDMFGKPDLSKDFIMKAILSV